MIKNKKGFIGDFISDFSSFLVFVLVLILFFLLLSLALVGCQRPGTENTMISEASNKLGEEMMLLNYLRTMVEVNGKQINIAELIAQSHRNNDYVLLEEKTLEFLDKIDSIILDGKSCSYVCINVNQRRVKTIETEGCNLFLIYTPCLNQNITIPLFYSELTKTAEVWLSYNEQGTPLGGVTIYP